jgi:hypothetical protein
MFETLNIATRLAGRDSENGEFKMSILTALGGHPSAPDYGTRPPRNSGSFIDYAAPNHDSQVTTLAVGEEGGHCPPRATTLAVGEEGGSHCPPQPGPPVTTQAIGEESGYCPPPSCPPPNYRPQRRPYCPGPRPHCPPVVVPGGHCRPNYTIPPGGIFDRPYQPPRFEYHLSKTCRPAPGTVIQLERHHEWGHTGCPPPTRSTGLGIFA